MIGKRIFSLFVVAMLFISTAPGYAYAFLSSDKAEAKANASLSKYKKGELLVKFKPGINGAIKAKVHADLGSKVLEEFNFLRIHHVRIKDGVGIETAIKKYKANPNIEYAEPNYLRAASVIPRDTDFKSLWGLNNTGQTGGTLDADIDGPEAWDITTGSSNVVVAVIDTGVDYTHSDLAANMWKNPGETGDGKETNGIDDDGNGYIDDVSGINAITGSGNPMDDYFHGTHVAGTIGAVGNNKTGVTGVNWNVKIMALKFLDASGYGSDSNAVKCFEYVRMMKATGINIVATSNSWGGGGYSQALFDAIYAQRDVLCVAAAGNSNISTDDMPNYPSCFELPNIIAVAATDSSDARAYFSNYGRTTVHIGAPGVDILSTVPGNSYETYKGTSMATPHVSGVAALLKAKDQSLDMIAIKNLILTGGDTISSMDSITITGKRLNAYGSLTRTDSALLSVLKYPVYPTPETTYTLSALSIKGTSVIGPVTATSNTGQITVLHDDGVAPDLYADDGIFSANWIAGASDVKLTFSSPAGTKSVYVSPLVITDYKLNYAATGRPYSDYIKATGGLQPYTWSVISGALPNGLSLNASTGEVSGIPTKPGTYNFTVQVTDGIQVTTQATSIEAGYDEIWLYNSGSDDRAEGIAIDANRNVYVAGHVNNGVNFDYQLVKYTPSGTVAWVRTYNGGSDDFGGGVATDADGNVYITGTSYRIGQGGSVIATIKYDALGNVIWSKDSVAISGLYGNGIAIDGSGNVYVGGSTYTPTILIEKLDRDGNKLWSKQMSGSCEGIAAGSDGNIYITGDSNVIKCDSSGNMVWTESLSIGSAAYGEDAAVDADGNVYVTGYYDTANYRDLFTAKYSPTGRVLWTKTYATDGDYVGTGITVDTSGNPHVAAYKNSSAETYCLTIKYDTAGNMIKVLKRDISILEYSQDLVVDSGNNIYVSGQKLDVLPDTGGYATDVSVTSTFDFDLFVIKYDLELPAITAFDVPNTCNSLTVPINAFTASDNGVVAGYMITESSLNPGLDDPRWSSTAPTSYAATKDGTVTLYAWVKDGAGNISASLSDTVLIITANTIAITKAEYVIKTTTLTVYATSDYGADAALQLEGYGPMTWNTKYEHWEKILTDLADAPATVIVFGPEGSKTATVTIK